MVVLISPPTVHAQCLALHYTVLCLPPGAGAGKRAALPLHGPLLQPHFVLPHGQQSLVIPSSSCLSPPRALGWLHSQCVFGTYTLVPYLLGFHSRVHGNSSAPALTNEAKNFVPCHEKVIADVFSPTVQMLLPQAGLSVEGFVELCSRKVILIWYFILWERLGGGRVSAKFPVLYRALEERMLGFYPTSSFLSLQLVQGTASSHWKRVLGKAHGLKPQMVKFSHFLNGLKVLLA